jgi:hypothetical protein
MIDFAMGMHSQKAPRMASQQARYFPFEISVLSMTAIFYPADA